jgi:hypothetical protein
MVEGRKPKQIGLFCCVPAKRLNSVARRIQRAIARTIFSHDGPVPVPIMSSRRQLWQLTAEQLSISQSRKDQKLLRKKQLEQPQNPVLHPRQWLATPADHNTSYRVRVLSWNVCSNTITHARKAEPHHY